MMTEAELLEWIKDLVGEGSFRLRPHAARHVIEEGFTETDILEAILGDCRILEIYPHESRCLIFGHYSISKNVRSPLHLVIEYLHEEVVDIVTAYIPQKPWWVAPWRRGKVK